MQTSFSMISPVHPSLTCFLSPIPFALTKPKKMSTFIRFRGLYLTVSSGLTLFEALFQNKNALPRDKNLL